jgi:hypothetical protein
MQHANNFDLKFAGGNDNQNPVIRLKYRTVVNPMGCLFPDPQIPGTMTLLGLIFLV